LEDATRNLPLGLPLYRRLEAVWVPGTAESCGIRRVEAVLEFGNGARISREPTDDDRGFFVVVWILSRGIASADVVYSFLFPFLFFSFLSPLSFFLSYVTLTH
jgi:hypothetical protein